MFSTNVHGKASDDGPSNWALAIYVGDRDIFPGSWLWAGPDLAIETIFGVNQ